MSSLAYPLREVPGCRTGRGKSREELSVFPELRKQSWESSKAMEVNFTGLRTAEMNREAAPDTSWGAPLSIQQSIDQCIHVRGLPEA